MTFLPKTLAAVTGSAAILALVAGFAPVQAQQEQTQEVQPSPAPQVDDATLEAFAQASLEVENVVSKWSSRIQEADGSEAEQLRSQADQEIVEAVQSNGLEVQTYNQIYQVAQSDPEVASKIQQYRQQMQ